MSRKPKSSGYLMGGVGEALATFRNMSTAIIRYPSGRYGIVGSVPLALTREQPNSFQVPTPRVSLVWESEQDVIDALLGIGLTHFQKADCTWYDAKDGAK